MCCVQRRSKQRNEGPMIPRESMVLGTEDGEVESGPGAQGLYVYQDGHLGERETEMSGES